MTPLRRRLIDELTRRNYSPRTVEAYVAAVARTARHFRRPPDQLTPDDLRAFQLHLIAKPASWSQFNQFAAALRFFYRHVLGRPEVVPFVPYGRNRVMFRVAYGCGLRLSELPPPGAGDIAPARRVLWVRRGKGGHDRGVPLPDQLLG